MLENDAHYLAPKSAYGCPLSTDLCGEDFGDINPHSSKHEHEIHEVVEKDERNSCCLASSIRRTGVDLRQRHQKTRSISSAMAPTPRRISRRTLRRSVVRTHGCFSVKSISHQCDIYDYANQASEAIKSRNQQYPQTGESNLLEKPGLISVNDWGST